LNPRYILAGILIVIPFAVYLDIPSYDIVSPELAGIPFYYWWQTLWLALTALLFFGAALLIDWGQPDQVQEVSN
jgi:ABC-type dipeptide/oligopeptide/nickel transport system permease component